MEFSLREAAREVGASKSTILRAVKSGRLSARRNDDGEYLVDAAELHRVYPLMRTASPDGALQAEGVDRCAPPSEAVEPPYDAPASVRAPGEARALVHEPLDLRIRAACLEAELEALKRIMEAECKQAEEMKQERARRIEELREERDRWRAQAERLALPAPVPNGEDEVRQERDYWREQAERLAMPVPAPPVERRGLLGWFRRAG